MRYEDLDDDVKEFIDDQLLIIWLKLMAAEQKLTEETDEI